MRSPTHRLLGAATLCLLALLALHCCATPTAAFGFGGFPSTASRFHQPGLFEFGGLGGGSDLWSHDDLLLSMMRPQHRPVRPPMQQWHAPRVHGNSMQQAQLRQLALQNERHEAHIAALQQQLAEQRSLLQQLMAAPQPDRLAAAKQMPQLGQQQARRVPIQEVQQQQAQQAPKAAPVHQAPQTHRYIIARNADNSIAVKRVPVDAPPQPQVQPKQTQTQSNPEQPTRPQTAHQCRRPSEQAPVHRQPIPPPTSAPKATPRATQPQRQAPKATAPAAAPAAASSPAQASPVTQQQQHQQQQQTKQAVPIATFSSAPASPPSAEDDDTPVLSAVEHPTHWDVSLPLPGVSAQFVHAEIRGKYLVMFGERHYEDKAVLLPEEVGRIGRYGVVRRVWKMPQPADANQRIDVQSAEARYDQSGEVLRVRLYKAGFLPPVQEQQQDGPNVRVAGPTIHVLVKTEGTPVRRQRIVLPPQPSPLDIDEQDEQQVEEATKPVVADPAQLEVVSPGSNLTAAPAAPVASSFVKSVPATLHGASA